jgi:uncharacterized protein YqeY
LGYTFRINNGRDAGQEVLSSARPCEERLGNGNVVSLREEIMRDTKEAMKSRERPRVEALRMLTAALKNAEIGKGAPLTEDEEQDILRRQLKQREESAEAFRKAGREEGAQAEEAEAELVRHYLPTPLSDEELEEIVDEAIRKAGASSVKDMGAVMSRATATASGRADNRKLAALVRERLQS